MSKCNMYSSRRQCNMFAEGVRSTPTPTTPTPEPTTTTLRIIKKVVCQPIDPNCSLPNTCQLRLSTSSQGDQDFECQSAVGNGVLFTLQPGDSFNLFEIQHAPGPFFYLNSVMIVMVR